MRAAADTEIEITKDGEAGIVRAAVTKQRDHLTGDEFAFRLEVIEIGRDDDGDPYSSCVLTPMEDARPIRKGPKLKGQTKIALELLKRAIADAGEPVPASNHVPNGMKGVRETLWRKYCDDGFLSNGTADAKAKAFKRGSLRLQEIDAIAAWNGWVWLT